jgi:hypothetical protein
MNKSSRPLCLLISVFITSLLSLSTEAAEMTVVQLLPHTTVRFATVEEGRIAIANTDAFTSALSRFDLQCRLNSEADVSPDLLMKLYADNVTAWSEQEISTVTQALEFIRERLAPFSIPQPKEILFIRTTGREEAGAAYCRGPAIVIPAALLRQSKQDLQRLIAHELFHVISTQNAELRRDLYAIIGFKLCDPVDVPFDLRDRLITNPDAPLRDAFIELELPNSEKVAAIPLLIASADKYDVSSGKSLFQYLQFKLLAIERVNDRWQAIEQDGKPRLLEPSELDSYASQIGSNTGYIIHPDEILADNFAHLIMQTKNLPNPNIIDRMQQRLTLPTP